MAKYLISFLSFLLPNNPQIHQKSSLLLGLFIGLYPVSSPLFAGAGDLDPTFGVGGLVTTDIGRKYDWGSISKTVIQPDGKIVASAPKPGFHLLRINPDGTLDEGFGAGGDLVVEIFGGIWQPDWTFNDFAVQPNGKIIVAGNTYISTQQSSDLLILRFNQDGSQDTTFGIDGKLIKDFSSRYGFNSRDNAIRIAANEDGSILIVVENTYRDPSDPWWFPEKRLHILVRLTPDGELDATFGTGGIQKFNLGYPENYVYDLVVQPDGKFMVNAQVDDGFSSAKNVLARYNPSGSLDGSFGVVEYAPPGGVFGGGRAMALQDDGKIILAGRADAYPEPSCGFGLKRYKADGTVDVAFGNNGEVLTNFDCSRRNPHRSSTAYSVAIKPDGKIIAFGELYTFISLDERYYDFALAQYNPDGSPDTGFGVDGKVVTELASRQSEPVSLAVQADGKVVAFGNIKEYVVDPNFFPAENPVMLRYNLDGWLDSGFGTQGVVKLPVSWTTSETAFDIIAVQGDGKIIAGGKTDRHYDDGDFALVRYTQDGSLDQAFGDNGKITTDFSFDHEQPCRFAYSQDDIYAIAVQHNGKILAVGWSYLELSGPSCPDSRTALALARYQPDGSIDVAFGTEGKVLLFGESYSCAIGRDMLVQPDGKIVVVGTLCGEGYLVARFNTDGTADATFANNGIFAWDPPNWASIRYGLSLTGVALQPDGKIVVAGGLFIETIGYHHLERWNLFRLNPDGTVDMSFNPAGGGIVNAFLGPHCKDLALQQDGKILVTGSALGEDTTEAAGQFTTLRYLPDGSLDTTFGANGMVQTTFGLGLGGWLDSNAAESIVVQADGRIVVGGFVNEMYETADGNFLSNLNFALQRYNSDGGYDYSFGTGGKVTTDFGSNNDRGYALTLQADGKILLAGGSSQNFRWLGNEIAIARYEGVSTKLDELEGLIVRVQELGADGALVHGQVKSLLAKLQASIQQVDRGNFGTAVKQLNAFMNEVEALVSAGILAPNQGQALNVEAQLIIGLLG